MHLTGKPARSVGELILRSLDADSGEAGRLATRMPLKALASVPAVAEEHGVILHVAAALQAVSIEPAVRDTLAQRMRQYTALQMRAEADLGELVPALQGLDTAFALVKGPALASYYPNPHLRSGLDVDVLIAHRDLHPVAKELVRRGARQLEDLKAVEAAGVGETSFLLPHGTALDLHWSLVHQRRTRSAFRLDTDELLARTRLLAVGGLPVPTLSEADTLNYTALHATLGGGDRLAWFEDLHRIVVAGVDWPKVVEYAEATGTRLTTAVMLARTRSLRQSPIPDRRLHDLAPRRFWRRLLEAADRWRSPVNTTGQPLRGQLVVRATRQGDLTSLAALASSVSREIIVPLARGSHPWLGKDGDGASADIGFGR